MNDEIKFDDLDPEKMSGRYIHYGRVLKDFLAKGGGIMVDFYSELQFLHEGIIADFMNSPKKFKNIKKMLLKSMFVVASHIKELTPEQLKENYNNLVKEEPDIWKNVKKQFGKSEPDYFQ